MKRSDFRRSRKKPKRKRYWIGAGIIALFMGANVLTNGHSSDNKDKSHKVALKDNKKSAEKVSKKKLASKPVEKKKEDTSKKKTNSISDQRKKINDEIRKSLDESKGFALGELDENGQPTENGTPNLAFAWSVVIKRIEYNENKHVDVYVNSGFKDFTDNEKSKVALMAQNKAVLFVGEAEKFTMDQYKKGIITFIYCDNDNVGRSHYTEPKIFKWN